MVGFAALTGDWHPQHTDAEWATESAVRRAHRPRAVRDLAGGRARPVRPRARGRAAARRRRRLQAPRQARRHAARRAARCSSVVRPSSEDAGLVAFAWNVLNQDERVVCPRARRGPLARRRHDRRRARGRRTRSTASSRSPCDAHARRQEAPHHRRHQPRVDRVRGRAPGPGGRRGGRAHRLRPRQAHDRPRGRAAPRAARRARARRQRPREPRGGRRRAARALGPRRRHPARDRVRPRGRARRPLPRPRRPRAPTMAFQTSAYSLKALAAALADLFPEEGGAHRRDGLRRAGRLAGLRLDGRGQGGAGGGQRATWRATSARAACA